MSSSAWEVMMHFALVIQDINKSLAILSKCLEDQICLSGWRSCLLVWGCATDCITMVKCQLNSC